MAPEVKHGRTAILSGEVKGYSRLLMKDKTGTTHTLMVYKGLIAGFLELYGGAAVDTPRGNILAKFGEVSDCVKCAVEIQKELKKRNDEAPEHQRIEFLLGVDLGEVVEKKGKIFGDGINVAVGIQRFAGTGGVCLSGAAYEQVRNKLEFWYEYLGRQKVKDFAGPVPVYLVSLEAQTASPVKRWKRTGLNYWRRIHPSVKIVMALIAAANTAWQLYPTFFHPPSGVASKMNMAFPLPDKPSIAVLPFVNLSEDPRQELFTDSMAIEIINALSKVQQVFVIARGSAFVYKGKTQKIKQVAEDLGVQYVLEGSVRRSGDTFRVTAQLIDAIKGHCLWSDRYDRTVKDVFALQDEITMKILTELRVRLTDGQIARVYEKGTRNLQAYLKVLEGDGHMRQYNKEANALAVRFYQEAIELDPNYAIAYTRLARTYTTEVYLRAGESREEKLSEAMKMAQKAVTLDRSSAEAFAALGYTLLTMGMHDEAIAAADRAVKLNPNSASALFTLAQCLHYSGRSGEAIPLLRQAIRSNPFVPVFYTFFASACRATGKYQEGIAAIRKSLKIAPNDIFANIVLAVLYVSVGSESKARAAGKEVMRIDPGFSSERYVNNQPWKDTARRASIIEDLHKAGIR